METELIGFIAQLITGIATLLVALVLVFQLRKQNQQLKIQHQDSDNKLTMDRISLFEKITIPNNYGDEFVNMMWKARTKGISGMTEAEIWQFETWLTTANRRIFAEFRLNRFAQIGIDNESAILTYYNYQYTFLFEYKAGLELYPILLRPRIANARNLGVPGLLEMVDKIYEEMSGKKIEDNNLGI